MGTHGSRTAKQFERGVQRLAIRQIDHQASWVQEICICSQIMHKKRYFGFFWFGITVRQFPFDL